MSLEAIKQVTDSEQLADQKKAAAVAEAARTIAQAQKQGDGLLEEAQQKAQAVAAQKLKDAEGRAEVEARQVEAKTQEECSALKAEAKGKLEDAAALIIRKVVGA